MKKINKKGFTLVELIVTITILGVVTLIALPGITAIQKNLNNRKYELFKNSIESTAKLYVDSRSEDVFGYDDNGCVEIDVTELGKVRILEDVNINNVACINDDTFVRVRKSGDKYEYNVFLNCTSNGEVVYSDNGVKGECSGIY